MDFTSKQDIDAPIAEVFEVLSDFDSFERSAFRRGVEVQRLGDTATPQSGLSWDATFTFRGKKRDLRIVLKSFEPVTGMVFSGESGAIQGASKIELMALSPSRTRMSITLDLSAKTLSGRLLLQSLKLARGSIDKKFKARAADFARMAEDRISQSA
ncbi:SRPBCC family protein [Phaeobacter sp. QD34_3]|uniref:SRPBCC family protein n=1 Tax=unclassified Phaeobacter TaxID=2621772 RepID=UPI00237F83A5|nr:MULTISPECIES: SRPBCC family protein [unclassified Phaeobacter]MDE4132586.1 SRPBCC family protein [Phaeobacter sp. QD34_3]MDE4136222.1 SRPBCC family protein [Phaeobacter sp. QD34_24]